MTVLNAKTLPEVYYGLHMVEGTAEYAEPNKKPMRIYIGESTIKNMNPTFQGKPVYVDHVDEVDVDNLQAEADGYVIDSFFNRADGKNWVKFIVVSDRGKEAVKMGWKLSNAYVPTSYAGGGENHGVAYSKEVVGAEYEHLAIVREPRYEESVILTPEQFKEYNAEKELELTRLQNSKEKPKEKKMAFTLFKRTKVENSSDMESMLVELPKSKKEMRLSTIISEFDTIQNMHGYANGEHMVKVGDKEMSVNALVKKHLQMMKSAKPEGEDDERGGGEPGVDKALHDETEDEGISEGVRDVDGRGGDKHLEDAADLPEMSEEEIDTEEESEEETEEEGHVKSPPPRKHAMKNALQIAKEKKIAAIKEKNRRIANAHLRDVEEETATVELACDQVARGKARYGS